MEHIKEFITIVVFVGMLWLVIEYAAIRIAKNIKDELRNK